MGYILAFWIGSMFGVVLMCVFQVSGEQSRLEENEIKKNKHNISNKNT